MFISRWVYDAERQERLKAQAEADAVRRQNIQLTAHIEWLHLRLVQVETERAFLLKKYMGVDIPVPEITPVDTPPDMNQTVSFEDMGDQQAEALGIGWNDDGSLRVEKR